MLIKESEIESLKQGMSNARIGKANKFVTDGDVVVEKIELTWMAEVVYLTGYVVDGNRSIGIRIGIDISDNTIKRTYCPTDFFGKACEHILAFAMEINRDKELEKQVHEVVDKEIERLQMERFNSMLESFTKLEINNNKAEINSEIIENNAIDILPVINKKFNEYELSFKIGKKKMYKIKSIIEFGDTLKKQEQIYFGEQIYYKNEEGAYTENAKAYLDWIVRYGEALKYAKEIADKNSRYYLKIPDGKIILNENSVDEFIECFKASNHNIEIEKSKKVLKVEEEAPRIQFIVSKNGDKYILKLKENAPEILRGNMYSYAILEDKIIQFKTKRYSNLMNLLKLYLSKGEDKYVFNEEGLKNFVSTVIMKVPEGIDISELPEEDKEKYIPKKLSVIMKLDVNSTGDIENNVTFCYGDFEFNPFGINSISIPRNKNEENEIILKMKNDGFVISPRTNNMFLKDEDKIYEFLSDRIEEYMAKYEVLISDDFKKKQVIQPRIGTIGVKIQNDLLSIDLSEINYDQKELADIMEKYKLKKRYYKLKDGSFLKLEQNNNMEFLDKLVEGMDIDFNKMKDGQIRLPVNRSLYLNRLLAKNPDIDVNEDREYKKLIDDTTNARNDQEIEIPKNLENVLRDYQKTGYKWLKALDRYKFGGILADDMGLRKNSSSDSFVANTRKGRNFYCCVSKLSIFKLEK